MSTRTRFGIFLALSAIFLGAFLFRVAGAPRASKRTAYVMGTIAQTTLYGSEKAVRAAEKAIDAEYAEILKVADPYNPESEISRLNRSAFDAPFRCGKAMWEILCEARRGYRLSEGAFDVSIRPLMELWGFYRKAGRIPSETEIAAVREKVGLDKVEFDDASRSVRFKVPGMALDLGGIAKGYALERAAGAALAAGVKSGVIDLGGNLRLLPKTPPGQNHYRVGIRRPGSRSAEIPRMLELPGNRAVSTSGDYERFVVLDGKRFGHIIDPASGTPPPLGGSVTSVYPEAARGDWISTAVYLRGDKLGERLKREFPDLELVTVPRRK